MKDSEGEFALRPEVVKFAGLMERVLEKNDFKGGWKNTMSSGELLRRAGQELKELRAELREKVKDPKKIAMEAADVANFMMMIADVCGGLSDKSSSQS